MKDHQVKDFSAFIAELATTGGMFNQGVMLTVQYGYVSDSNIVHNDGVLVTDAGARATRSLVLWADTQEPKLFASIHNGGLLIT